MSLYSSKCAIMGLEVDDTSDKTFKKKGDSRKRQNI